MKLYQKKEKLIPFTLVGTKPIEARKTKKKVYEVTVTHMHGDADFYSTDKQTFKNHKDMLDYVNFMYRCMNEFTHGMGGDDGYWEVEGYDKYGDHLYKEDPHGCVDGHATVDGIEIFYFDENGYKLDVVLS